MLQVWNKCLVSIVCATALGWGGNSPAEAQGIAGAEASNPAGDSELGEVVVTARRREESLQNVPIAVTALSGDQLEQRQIYQVKDIAAISPGLNINSDSAGRSFVSIRGIGTTLINTVQPGVGIFLDGIYQPDTSYLNSPIVDVERIEVLRGPQGTLFGNNTLGGAINVITRQPSDTFEGKVSGAYAGPDNFYSAALSLSGPIIPGVLQGRIAIADHRQTGFSENDLAGSHGNPLDQRSLNTTLRWEVATGATITMNGYYNRVFGGNLPYAHVAGPQDYERDNANNDNPVVTLIYKGANLKGVFDVAPFSTTITAVAAYDRRNGWTGGDGDYSPIDLLRASTSDVLDTTTGELRFDTNWNDHVSTLFGVFANRVASKSSSTNVLVPFGASATTAAESEANTQAFFGTAFFRFLDTWELATGIRYDHQVLGASNDTTAGAYKASEWEPRLTLTDHLTSDLMLYASISRGFRGGGQNGPGAPVLIYKGDSVVTTEFGTKLTAFDHRLTIDADVFYNNYAHFIGQNALAPSTTGVGFVAINLNSGQVRSYGFELESHLKVTPQWRIDAGLTLMKARIVNPGEFNQATSSSQASDRILFTPDYNYNLDSSYTVPLARDSSLEFQVGAVAKGNRNGSSLNPAYVPVLAPYTLVNGSVTYRFDRAEIALFGTNLTNKRYFEAYIDGSDLSAAGFPPPLVSSLGLLGDLRRVGIRGNYRF